MDHNAACPGCELTLIDLAEIDLPMLSEPVPALFGQYTQDTTRRWAELIDRFDGYVLVSPEYNHSTSAVLKTPWTISTGNGGTSR